jgi:hypothetical protein
VPAREIIRLLRDKPAVLGLAEKRARHAGGLPRHGRHRLWRPARSVRRADGQP